MSDKKISQLTAATTPLAGTEVVPLVQSGVTKKVPVSDLTAGRTVSAARLDSVASATNLVEITGKQIVFYNVGISNAVIKAADDSSSVNALEFNKTQVIVSTGNLVIGTAGKGIDFSADPSAAGMTSELLDDYEEGTWTPTQGAGLTVSGTFSSAGTYTKVGRQVTVTAELNATTSVTASAGGLACGGLPFNVVGVHAGSITSNALNQAGSCSAYLTGLYSGTTTSAATGLIFTATYFV